MKKLSVTFLILCIMAINTVNAQNSQDSNLQIVEKFLAGFNDPSKIGASLNLLADDYKFKNPMVQLENKTQFIALAQEMGKVLTGVELMSIAQNGDWVATYYEFKSSIPGLESNFGTEWFRVENGKIQESTLIYDASEWRKVYAQMNNK